MEKIYFSSMLFIFMTPLLCISSMNWILIWICLEINTLSFSFILSQSSTKSESIECSLKYFIVQSSASACLLFSILLMSEKTTMMKMLIPFMIILKLGMIPTHSWFVSIGMKMKWKILATMMTWQKLMPIYLLIFSTKYVILISAMISMIMGTILQYKNVDSKKLMIYSSISNSCWILFASMLNMQMTLTFCTIYFFTVIVMMMSMEKKMIQKNNSQIKDNEELTLMFLLILLLAGMPPSISFLPKWMLFKEFLLNNISFTAMMMFFFTTVNFYIYLRLFMKIMTKKENMNFSSMKSSKKAKILALTLTFFGLSTVSLFCFAWKSIILME